MNVLFSPPPRAPDLAVAHAITAYDRSSDSLVHEFEIPLSLDELAMKIAEVEEDDPFGALSYPLADRQMTAFKFIFGVRSSPSNALFYFEPWTRHESRVPPDAGRLFSRLKEVGLKPSRLGASGPINERELTIPTLRLLSEAPQGFRSTTDLKNELVRRLQPVGRDAKLLASRNDTHFAQKVRNMVSNRFAHYSFIRRGYASYDQVLSGLTITDRGRGILSDLDKYGRRASRA